MQLIDRSYSADFSAERYILKCMRPKIILLNTDLPT